MIVITMILVDYALVAATLARHKPIRVETRVIGEQTVLLSAKPVAMLVVALAPRDLMAKVLLQFVKAFTARHRRTRTRLGKEADVASAYGRISAVVELLAPDELPLPTATPSTGSTGLRLKKDVI